MRKYQWMATTLALGSLAGLAGAGEAPIVRLSTTSAQLHLNNQTLADELAAAYKSSGQIHDYAVEIEADGGVVTLTGTVANDAQRASLLNLTRRFPGVVAVNDKVVASTSEGLVVARFDAGDAPKPLPGGPVSEKTAAGFHPVLPPVPVTGFPGGVVPFTDAPAVPPYAWPAYSPYNNYASMAYQTQYPSGAWPFIGPPYPYPMIPAGWRRTTLSWHGGYWYMRFHAF